MDDMSHTTIEHWNAEAIEHLLYERRIDFRPRREEGRWHAHEALPEDTPVVQITAGPADPRLHLVTVREALASLGPEAFASKPWPGEEPLPEQPPGIVAALLQTARRAWRGPAREARLKTAQVHFEGSGDSGQLEYVTLQPWRPGAQKAPMVPALAERPWGWAPGRPGRATRWRLTWIPLDEALEEDATYLVDRQDLPDWTNNTGGFVQLHYDLETATRTVEVYQYPDPQLVYHAAEPPVAA